ncbi:hypothetical protein LOY97_005500, partial [Ophidiomyces ophidiicola]
MTKKIRRNLKDTATTTMMIRNIRKKRSIKGMMMMTTMMNIRKRRRIRSTRIMMTMMIRKSPSMRRSAAKNMDAPSTDKADMAVAHMAVSKNILNPPIVRILVMEDSNRAVDMVETHTGNSRVTLSPPAVMTLAMEGTNRVVGMVVHHMDASKSILNLRIAMILGMEDTSRAEDMVVDNIKADMVKKDKLADMAAVREVIPAAMVKKLASSTAAMSPRADAAQNHAKENPEGMKAARTEVEMTGAMAAKRGSSVASSHTRGVMTMIGIAPMTKAMTVAGSITAGT